MQTRGHIHTDFRHAFMKKNVKLLYGRYIILCCLKTWVLLYVHTLLRFNIIDFSIAFIAYNIEVPRSSTKWTLQILHRNVRNIKRQILYDRLQIAYFFPVNIVNDMQRSISVYQQISAFYSTCQYRHNPRVLLA